MESRFRHGLYPGLAGFHSNNRGNDNEIDLGEIRRGYDMWPSRPMGLALALGSSWS